MNLLLLIAAIFIAFLVFTLLIKVVRATISTAITIAIIVLVLQLVFGIGPSEVFNQVNQFFQSLWHLITGQR